MLHIGCALGRALLLSCAIAMAGGHGGCSGDDGNGRHVQTTPSPPQALPPDATAPPPPPPAGPAAELSEDMAVDYFADGPAAAAAAAFRTQRWAQARQGFLRVAAQKTVDEPLRDRARLMAALAASELGMWKEAATEFASVRPRLALLSDWLTFQEARSLFFGRRFSEAMTRARAVPAASTSGADAELLVGDMLRGGADHAATAAHYAGYLKARPRGIRRSEVRFRLAEALGNVGGATAPSEQFALLRAITVEDPLSAWAGRAEAALAALAPRLPPELAAKLGTLSAQEHVTRGMELFDAMRNPESEAAFRAALAASDLSADVGCVAAYHLAQSLFKARNRTAAAPGFDDAAVRCQAAKNTDLQIKSAYQAGRSYAFIGQHDVALARYQAAQKVDRSHSYTDDALLREAEEHADLGDDAAVVAALSRIPTEFPQGDMKAEALWRLGWRAWRAGSVDEAITWWKKQIESTPIDNNYWAEGQPQYWLGRAYHKLGKVAPAMAAWEDAVRTYPMQYYALLALNRIREVDPSRYAKLMTELGTDPAEGSGGFAFKARPEWGSPGFLRGMEFLRLGLGNEAEAELRAAGLSAPPDKKEVTDPDRIDKLWAMSFLYDRAGRYSTSHWPTRWHILDYRRNWPLGANRQRWQIAYPKGYWDLLSEHATRNQVPIAMQIAIVREESGFDPRRESYANAIGLTQMINSTATRFGKGTGIEPTRENLRDPVKNVTIGSRFLGFLYKHWNGFTHLVPPGYNAGEGAVARMLRLRGTWSADEFIEGIVDDQARNYSKRVLGSYFTYSWLYEQTVPVMPNTIPAELVTRALKK